MRIICRQYTAVLMFFVLLQCAGCGFAGNAANRVKTVQLPSGKLCSTEFYLTATPDDVKKEIGGRSLAEERYVRKSVAKASSGGSFVGGFMHGLMAPFVPDTYVEETTISPLDAAWRTPYPEVMVILLDAGAGQFKEREKAGYIHETLNDFLRQHSDKKSFGLLRPYLSPDPCERFMGFFRGDKISAFDDYLAFFPDTDLNCRGKDGKTPLEKAMSSSKERVQWLLRKGADPERPFSRGKTPLAHAALSQKHIVGLLLAYGAKVAPLTEDERRGLLNALEWELGNNFLPEEEEKLKKLFEKAIREGNQQMLKVLGTICILPREERRARLEKLLERG